MKLGKWSLYNQKPISDNYYLYIMAFAESNQMYNSSYDSCLEFLWRTTSDVYDRIEKHNMTRWLPVDFYFQISALSSVWFFSLHLKQPALCDIDMKCNRYIIPLKRGAIRADPTPISVIAYLTGVLPSDYVLLRTVFPEAEISGNEVTIHMS